MNPRIRKGAVQLRSNVQATCNVVVISKLEGPYLAILLLEGILLITRF
jgi:hypothetical protein